MLELDMANVLSPNWYVGLHRASQEELGSYYDSGLRQWSKHILAAKDQVNAVCCHTARALSVV
jgi:hypothetical protein